MKQKYFLAALLCATIAFSATVQVSPDSIRQGQINTWSASNKYVLHGHIVIGNGTQLRIPAGTIVAADFSGGANTSMLIVTRGGRLYAEGTENNPVIFTSVLDTMGIRLPISNRSRGLWGGVIILGKAPNNYPGGVTDVSDDISNVPLSMLRCGDSVTADQHDTSGVLRYVSIRYAGKVDLSSVKSLVLGSVGDGTVIEDVEVFCCAEDGFYIMGGTVNLKRCISVFQAGDCFYYEGGYQGKGQFLFGMQCVVPGSSSNGCCAKLESDDLGANPIAMGQFYNVTFLGTGKDNLDTWKYKYAVYYKANGAGTLANSIVSEASRYGIFVDSVNNTLLSSRARLADDKLVIRNNIFYNFGKGNTWDSIAARSGSFISYLPSNSNDLQDPLFKKLSWPKVSDSTIFKTDSLLDPRPTAAIASQNLAPIASDAFFENVTYRGAFSPTGAVWARGWSTLAKFGMFSIDAVTETAAESNKAVVKGLSPQLSGAGNLRTITWYQNRTGMAKAAIYDIHGRELALISNSLCHTGSNQVNFSLRNYSNGIYLVRVTQNGHSDALSLVKVGN